MGLRWQHHESMTRDMSNDSMTTSLIRQYYGWFNERRLSDAAGLFADDADVELIPGERAQGGSGYLRFAYAWVSAFPDATFAIQQIEHRTETLAEVYLLATGTHQGTLDFGPYRFRPGGAKATLHVRELLDIRNGKIVSSALTADLNDLVTQLSRVDYDELAGHLERIRALSDDLAHAADDPARQRHIVNRLGVELDAARRATRPHSYR